MLTPPPSYPKNGSFYHVHIKSKLLKIYTFCFNIPQDPSRVLCGRDARLLLRKCDLNTANDGASAKASPFHALTVLGKNDCPYWLVVWPICLNFMLCLLLEPLYASTRTPSKGTCAKPLIIVSQYSTGPQHNMGCKYKFDIDRITAYLRNQYTLQIVIKPYSN